MRRWRGEWIEDVGRWIEGMQQLKLIEGKDKNEGTRKVCV